MICGPFEVKMADNGMYTFRVDLSECKLAWLRVILKYFLNTKVIFILSLAVSYEVIII